MPALSATQHRIAFLLLIASLAFAATTVFMLCLLQPKSDGPSGKTSKKMNHNNGEDAYVALAGLPIRKRQVSDARTSVDGLKQTILAHGDTQRHGGSVLPVDSRKELDARMQGALLDDSAAIRSDQETGRFAWQRMTLQDDRREHQAVLLVDESAIRFVDAGEASDDCYEDENVDDRLLRMMSGMPGNPKQASTVNNEQAKQAAIAAGLAQGFLLDVPHPAHQ